MVIPLVPEWVWPILVDLGRRALKYSSCGGLSAWLDWCLLESKTTWIGSLTEIFHLQLK